MQMRTNLFKCALIYANDELIYANDALIYANVH
jgi:hypothetical protein